MENKLKNDNTPKPAYAKPEITEVNVAVNETLMAMRSANSDVTTMCTKHTHCTGPVCSGPGVP